MHGLRFRFGVSVKGWDFRIIVHVLVDRGFGFGGLGSGFRAENEELKGKDGYGFTSWNHLFGILGKGFKVQGSGFRVQGSGFRVQGSGFGVWYSEFRI